MNLFLNYYVDPSPERQRELEECLKKNIENNQVDKIFVLCLATDFPIFGDGRVLLIPISTRPTFRDYFNLINGVTGPDDTNVIINSDIYLREPIPAPMYNQCFALTRYNVLPDGTEQFHNNPGSQDTWVFRGPVRMVDGADFTQGIAGCDNKIAYLLQTAGYEVLNPSKTIKTYHLHNSGVRHYDKKKFRQQNGKMDIYRLPRPRINVPIS